MLWKNWNVWSRFPRSRRREKAFRKWGVSQGIELLENRTLLSAINGVNVAAEFDLNTAIASKRDIGFVLNTLTQDSDGDGNVNGRTVTFTGTISAVIGGLEIQLTECRQSIRRGPFSAVRPFHTQAAHRHSRCPLPCGMSARLRF